jgi:hypothetical protein
MMVSACGLRKPSQKAPPAHRYNFSGIQVESALKQINERKYEAAVLKMRYKRYFKNRSCF